MVQIDFKDYQKYLIAVLVGLFALYAFWIRIIPMLMMGQQTDILSMVAMDDPLYNLRQVEVMLSQFPGYAWFDPMTLYPGGSTIYWGPVMPTIIAICCLLAGATTRPEIISVALLVPPLLAAATVVAMYYAGRVFGNWKTGLLASGFTAVVFGQFFTVSYYGYIDHHIAEVLFSTIFCLTYGYALVVGKNSPVDLSDRSSYRNLLIVSVFSGIAYLLGLFVMPTMILFAMIVALFTLIQFIIDFYRRRSSDYLVLINGVTFGIAIPGLLLFGLKSPGIDLSTYSIGHIIAYLGLIAGTCLLWYLARFLREKPRYTYPGILAGCAILSTSLLYIFIPALYGLFISSLFSFFGQYAVTNTVLEAMGWSYDHAWGSFNYGLLLFAGGVLVILYRNIRNEHPHHIFSLVWSLVILLSTCQHIRYEYYLAINIALLSAICVTFVVEVSGHDLSRIASRISETSHNPGSAEPAKEDSLKKKPGKQGKKPVDLSHSPDYLRLALLLIVSLVALLFVYTSATLAYTMVSAAGTNMNSDWKESLEWLGNNTPETGVDYLAIYDQKTYQSPNSAYGVMSWWDYGHMISFIAKRIPNANPFQQGVAGPNGSATYFVATSEEEANRILDNDGTRYVITDIMMDDVINGKFHAMATWHNSTAGLSPFIQVFLMPNQENTSQLDPTGFVQPAYYHTMISRLHTFDGSMTNASAAYYIEYADPSVTGLSQPVIVSGGLLNATEAERMLTQFNTSGAVGYRAGLYSYNILKPADTVPALRHYRLIHESPTNVYDSESVDVRFVKVFEYVPGAHIRGEGIISVPVVTNTGRTFTYRQESINGEFVVPYATSGNSGDVKTNGVYTIEGTGKTYTVPESAVTGGLYIT
ncbi:oligosaccharyl transferase, archaeosortase A system-associated [Methanoregula sp.]|uniref:oligosaccharyl transferase, archaeosortase A system-associated n=1 Tax=Methanoregula sp. TaxID=2052170 RepID=UPI00236B291F|nr:oligosaccharyl transferase, archaeosortase A system-associated [Methanoregula sp.]MDD1685395.1 oligosaccharyl transferase, archaeosortase A system-associated [Methanoregula sp.]